MTQGASPPAPILRGLNGILHLLSESDRDSTGGGGDPCVHVSEFVNGSGGIYLEDNDLRGFLDGRFAAGWNQVGQSYTRVGRYRRAQRPPEFGEDELFRTLHRWSGIQLPAGSHIRNARLLLRTYTPIPKEHLLYLYAMRRDWNPGRGGVREDNVSTPQKGEVWWGDAKYDEEPWGLPGASFAADGHLLADTDAEPLAWVHGPAGSDRIEFAGPRLTEYVQRRTESGEPLLLLLKASDELEDDPAGSLIKIVSGEFGRDGGSEFRPRFHLEWTPPPESRCRKEAIFLEYGRERILRSLDLPKGDRLWSSFISHEGFERPTLQYRDSVRDDSDSDPWRLLSGPVTTGSGVIDVRVLAARKPIVLGNAFVARFQDSWVVSAPPEDQSLEWRFTSPSGVSSRVAADYEGRFTWSVSFVPDEPGRWTAQWSHQFTGPDESGPVECFDVVADDVTEVIDRLRRLEERIRNDPPTGAALENALAQFHRLERTGMRSMTPESFQSSLGARFQFALDGVRELLARKPLPPRGEMTSIPLRREAGGHEFVEPIPWHAAFRSTDYEPADPFTKVAWESLRRFLRRWTRRVLRRIRS